MNRFVVLAIGALVLGVTAVGAGGAMSDTLLGHTEFDVDDVGEITPKGIYSAKCARANDTAGKLGGACTLGSVEGAHGVCTCIWDKAGAGEL